MADLINLRTARKQRLRAEARRQVAVRSGDEGERARAEAALDRKRLDGQCLEAHRFEGEARTGGKPGGDAGQDG